MDKFVKRTTLRGASKRNYEENKMTANPAELTAGWQRCDSMTESEHNRKKSRGSPSKRKKLEHAWSPIKSHETLATIEEYPTLSVAKKSEAKAAAFNVKNGSVGSDTALTSPNVSGVSLYDLSLDFGNKSWGDLYEEEEAYAKSADLSVGSTSEKTTSSPKSAKKRRSDKVKFKEDSVLTKEIGDNLKFDTLRKSDVWLHRLRSPAKRQADDQESSTVARKSPRLNSSNQRFPSKSSSANSGKRSTGHSLHWSKSPKHSPYRKRPLIDEDSQNTLTEVAQITQNVRLKPREEDTTQSFSDCERPKRQITQPARFPLAEHGIQPKLGWEEDPAVLQRREKELAKGYNSDVYKQYISLVNKKNRIKGLHPRTPNKLLKMPRRSWDTQVRVWRRLLYAAVNVDPPSDASFMSYTSCSETTSEHDMSEIKLDLDDEVMVIQKVDDEENTLKETFHNGTPVSGPTDFTVLSTNF